MNKLSRTGNFVNLTQPGFTVKFDTNYGGAPLSWTNTRNGKVVVNSFAGEGAQAVADSGQDTTQATPDGPDFYPLSLLGDVSPRRYYAREEVFRDSGTGYEALYQVDGPAPYFWVSLDAADDSTPPDPRGPSGWSTRYNDILNFGPAVYEGMGCPIFGRPSGAVTSGIIFLGNEIVEQYHPGRPWNEHLNEIPFGNIAVRTNVSMKHADSTALAAILFRKSVPAGAGVDINTAYGADGAMLYVNRAGGAAVHVTINGQTHITKVCDNTPAYAALLGTEDGLLVELRSHVTDNFVDVYIDATFKVTVDVTVRGPHSGLFFQCASGYVKFSNRQFFDIGVNLINSYRSTIKNTLLWSSTVYRVAAPFFAPFYRTNLPIVYTEPSVRQKIMVWDKKGRLLSVSPGLISLDDVGALYAGLADGSAGVFCLIHAISRVAGVTPHAGIWPNAIALSALSEAANETPEYISYHTIVTEWAPEVRQDLLNQLAY